MSDWKGPFWLDRIEDEGGVSGTGRVAEGYIFEDGSCTLRWLTEFRSTAVYESLEVLEQIHGHNGKTKITRRAPSPALVEMQEALTWIRKKLKLPADTQMFSGTDTIAGALHNLCFDAHGYQTYIVAFKCDDKQGEIARLTVRTERAEDALAQMREACQALRDWTMRMAWVRMSIDEAKDLDIANDLADKTLSSCACGTCDGSGFVDTHGFDPGGGEHEGRFECEECKRAGRKHASPADGPGDNAHAKAIAYNHLRIKDASLPDGLDRKHVGTIVGTYIPDGLVWKCKACKSCDPPQDCEWPTCGCDPYADKVIDALQEGGAIVSSGLVEEVRWLLNHAYLDSDAYSLEERLEWDRRYDALPEYMRNLSRLKGGK